MGTRAHYYLWAGFLLQDQDEDLPEELESFLEKVRKTYPSIEREGVSFTSISMHGETIGYGVILTDLEWITTEERPESPDTTRLLTLREFHETVRLAFRKIGLPEEIPCNLYHHLDLGG